MTQLFCYYRNAYKNSEIGAQTHNTKSSLSTTSFLGDQEEQNAYHMVKRRREHASSLTSSGLYALQHYLNQHLLEINKEGSFDLLGWWKTNQSKYPVLFIRAHEILSVHVSGVTLEATFSTSGRVVSNKRCGRSPKTIVCNTHRRATAKTEVHKQLSTNLTQQAQQNYNYKKLSP